MQLRRLWRLAVLLGGGLLYSTPVAAQAVQAGPFHINVTTSVPTGDVALPLQILLLITLLRLSYLLLAMTSFAPFWSCCRFCGEAWHATNPPNQVLMAWPSSSPCLSCSLWGTAASTGGAIYLEQITTQAATAGYRADTRLYAPTRARRICTSLCRSVVKSSQITPDDITLASCPPLSSAS
jgi:hypothetical protein